MRRLALVFACAFTAAPLLVLTSSEPPVRPAELQAADAIAEKGDPEATITALVAAIESPAVKRTRGAEAEARYELAVAHNNLGDYVTALRFAEDAEALFRRAGLPNESAIALLGMGALQSTLKRHGDAERSLMRALTVLRRAGDDRRVASALLNLGTNLATQDRIAEALDKLREAAAVSARIGYKPTQAMALNNIAGTYLRGGDYEGSRQPISTAIELFRSLNDHLNEAAALAMLARAELRLDQAALALQHANDGLRLVEAERAKLLTPELQATLAGSFQPVFDALLQVQLGTQSDSRVDDLEAAFRTSERARARLLLDRLWAVQTELGTMADPAAVRDVDRLKAELEPRAGTLQPDDAVLVRYRQAQARVLNSTSSGRAMSPPPDVGFEQVRRTLLKPGDTLIEYWLGEDSSIAWVVAPDLARAYRLPKREVIERQAQLFVAAVRDPAVSVAQVNAVGATLADSVLPPSLVEAVTPGRLLIVTHGALDLVPFAALPVAAEGSNDRRPLVAMHELVYLPSAASAIASVSGGARSQPVRTLGVFADPVVQGEAAAEVSSALRAALGERLDSLGSLPGTKAEAAAIASLLPASDVDVWAGARATRDRVKATAGSYRLLHFATHGVVSIDRPETSGLLLSAASASERVGYLGLADIYSLRLAADLVVLSACETALGRQIRGEGVIGLTMGFRVAGARRVIASLWRVDDNATQRLMENLYEGLLVRRDRPSAALRAAQLRETSRHPYYWAAFAVYGD